MKIFKDKLLTSTSCDKAGDYAVPNVTVLSPRDLVSRPDLSDINCSIIITYSNFSILKNCYKITHSSDFSTVVVL